MKYKLIVSPEAEADIDNAFEWYEDREEGLGRDFLFEARSSMKRITAHPLSFPLALGKTRRVLLDRFPYSVYYTVIDATIKVTACIHQRRHPRVWRSRT
jgi:plasmid stabilization system protein ParE